MARNNTTTINLGLSASQASQTIKALESQAGNLRKALQAAVDAGDKAKSKKIQGEIRQTENVLRRMRTEAASAADVLSRLDKASPKELRTTLQSLNRQIQNLPRGSREFEEMASKIRSVKGALQDVSKEMQKQPSLWERIKGAGAGAVAVFQKGWDIISGMSARMEQYVNDYAGMQEQMAGVSKYSGMSAEDVAELNEAFKKMDTRTSREQLNMLAQDAGRLGKTSVEDVLGFVSAADKINVALDDLGDGATLTLSKITGLFGIEAEFGTEKALLKAGSVINELSQNCSASASYISEFTTRLAATGKAANMSIPQIMAYAAVMDTAGVNVEQSSTAISKLIMKLYQDPAKYAQAAGLEIEKFKEMMKMDANEGFLQFLEGLKQRGNLDALAPILKELGENGIGSMNAINLLAGSLDQVRAQQEAANAAFEDGTSITKEYEQANNTVAAELEKNKKEIHETAVAIGEQLLPAYNLFAASTSAAMKAASWLIKTLMENKGTILTLAAAYAAYVVAANIAIIKMNTIKALKTTLIALKTAGKAATLLLAAAYNTLTGNTTRAAAAMKMFNATTKLSVSGIGLLVGAITLAIGLLIKYATRLSDTSRAAKELNSIKKEGEKRAAEEIIQIQALVKVAEDETQSLDNRQKAVNRLNALIPHYNAQLDATTRRYRANKKALDDYIASLKQKYMLEGARDKLRELGKQRAEKEVELAEQQDHLKDISQNTSNVSNQGRNNATTSGANMPAVTFNLMGNSADRSVTEGKISSLQKDISGIDKAVDVIVKKYPGVGSDDSDKTFTEPKELGGSGGGGSRGGGSRGGGGGHAHQTPEEKKAAENEKKKQSEEFQQGLDKIAKTRQDSDKENIALYQAGTISLIEMKERLYKSEIKMIDDIIDFYKEQGLQDDKDIEELNKKKSEFSAAWNEKKKKQEISDIKQEQKWNEEQAQLEYATPGSEIFRNEEALQEKLFQIRINALERIRDQYDITSDEYAEKSAEIDDALNEEMVRKQKRTAELMMQYSESYQLQELETREKMEISALEELHKKELISEEDYQKALDEIRKKFRKERKEMEPDAKKKKTTADYTANSEWGSMVTAMYESITMAMDDSEKALVAWSKKVAAIAQASFAMISAITQQISSYTSAQVEYETALVEKSYDKRIKAAKNNNALQKRLEEQKEKAIAKIKAKAEKENFAIQVATAVAQTAANAISAYGSVVGIPVIGPTLAPIAAAMAIAAGSIQIATIKKQQQAAEAKGYSEGGFTMPGDKDQPAGIVHAGEWVASQKLVNNPQTRPLINMLEYARLHNALPSITASDVSRTVTAPIMAASSTTAPVRAVPDSASNPTENKSQFTDMQDVLMRLASVLENGISATVSMTGKNGLSEAKRRYNQIMSNKNIR